MLLLLNTNINNNNNNNTYDEYDDTIARNISFLIELRNTFTRHSLVPRIIARELFIEFPENNNLKINNYIYI